MAESRDLALLLRQIPFRESSLVLQLLTQSHGRIALMAKGIRRANHRLRPHLAPLSPLTLRWVGGSRGMGTLTDLARGKALLPPSHHLAGMELLALSGKLFRSGDPHGFPETIAAIARLAQSPDSILGSCRAGWLLLQQAGTVSSLDHCWSCGVELPTTHHAHWQQQQCRCDQCCHPAAGASMPLSSDLRALVNGEARLPTPEQILHWQQIIQQGAQPSCI
ncbi:MAG: recombination protein O N-terminal domain-containing protein [Mariprofundales bacterium]|nr:recombination protein O N-terminal domain-containing protein [Mariprofundales bacterium]